MLAARSIVAKRALAVGDLFVEYPEAPRNKPYRSILALPLIGTDEESVIGVVSVDSSRPYFFQSFREGVVENELEDSLQPYLQTLVLTLECVLARNSHAFLQSLIGGVTVPEG